MERPIRSPLNEQFNSSPTSIQNLELPNLTHYFKTFPCDSITLEYAIRTRRKILLGNPNSLVPFLTLRELPLFKTAFSVNLKTCTTIDDQSILRCKKSWDKSQIQTFWENTQNVIWLRPESDPSLLHSVIKLLHQRKKSKFSLWCF